MLKPTRIPDAEIAVRNIKSNPSLLRILNYQQLQNLVESELEEAFLMKIKTSIDELTQAKAFLKKVVNAISQVDDYFFKLIEEVKSKPSDSYHFLKMYHSAIHQSEKVKNKIILQLFASYYFSQPSLTTLSDINDALVILISNAVHTNKAHILYRILKANPPLFILQATDEVNASQLANLIKESQNKIKPLETPGDVLTKYVSILTPLLSEKGFKFKIVKDSVYRGGEHDEAIGIFYRNHLQLFIHFYYEINGVTYSDGNTNIEHFAYMTSLGFENSCKYRGFTSAKVEDKFYNLLHDLQHYAVSFLNGKL